MRIVCLAVALLLFSACGGLEPMTADLNETDDTEDPQGSECNDGSLDDGEDCDVDDFRGVTCLSLGHTGGSLRCDLECLIDDSQCTDGSIVPERWNCSDSLYGSGGGCDCGCGEIDPDCSSMSADACDQCSSTGSCAVPGHGCPSDIDPNNNAVCDPATCNDGTITVPELCDGYDVGSTDCVDLGFSGGSLRCNSTCDDYDTSTCQGGTVPTSWDCSASYYDADDGCDCGCGANDPDCPDITATDCEFCTNSGSCAGSCLDIDPADNSTCVTGTSNCGNNSIESPELCDGTDLGGNDCTTVPGGFSGGTLSCTGTCGAWDTGLCFSGGAVPPGWTCDGIWWADGFCDCGCGEVDSDCDDATVGSCDYCDDWGSCSLSACPGSINPTDNATCSGSTGAGKPDSAGDIVLSEFMPNPATLSDSNGEWFELHNPGSDDLNLLGCEVRSDPSNKLTIGAVTVTAGGYSTWGASSSPGFTPDTIYSTAMLSLRNSDDTFELWCDPGSGMTLIDGIAYNSSTGWPVNAGESVALDPGSLNHTANDNASNWCAGTASYNGDLGSPGSANTTCP